MNYNELKIESLQIEDNIQEQITHEKWKNELSIMNICIVILVFMIFIFTPLYFLFATNEPKEVLMQGYSLMFVVCAIGIIYYFVGRKILKKNPGMLNVFRVVNITLESVIIASVFYLLYVIHDGLNILAGPVYLMFMVVNLLSLFRLSFGCEVYSAVLCSCLYLSESLYIIYKDGEMLPQIYDYSLISGGGIWLKILFLIVIGIVCGALSKKARKLIRQVALKNYETSHVKMVFGKYVSPEIRDYILKSREYEDNETSEDFGVILFCDINNFSEVLEKYEPKAVVSQLNVFFENMENIISKNGGVINKFVGSCIMAVFGLGKNEEDKADICKSVVTAALEMKEMIDSMNNLWKMNNYSTFDIGIGVSFGNFIVGNIGSKTRKEFTCLGNTVNVASRLQSKTRCSDMARVLVTAEIFQLLEDEKLKAHFNAPVLMSLKGKSQQVEVYSL